MSAIVKKHFFRHYLLASLLGSIWFALLEFGPGMQNLDKRTSKKVMAKKESNSKKFRNHTGIHVFLFTWTALRSTNGFQLLKREQEQNNVSLCDVRFKGLGSPFWASHHLLEAVGQKMLKPNPHHLWQVQHPHPTRQPSRVIFAQVKSEALML